MGKRYSQLSVDERNQMQRGLNAGQSLRALARSMNRSPGTLSRECRRGDGSRHSYDAVRGGIGRRRNVGVARASYCLETP